MPNLKQMIGGFNYTNFDGYEFVDNTMQTIPGLWNKVTKAKKVIVFENLTYSKNGVKYDLGTCTLNFSKVQPYVYAYIVKDIVSGGAVTLFQVRISNQDKMLIKAVSSTSAQEVDISGKADKVENAHAGNFASLDSTGDLIDSGVSPDDIGGGVNYSTTEQDTGLKWTDGKTIYQKTYTGSVSIGTSGTDQKTLATNVNISKLIKMEGYFHCTHNDFDKRYPLGYASNDERYNAFLVANDLSTMSKSFASKNFDYAITLYYTK